MMRLHRIIAEEKYPNCRTLAEELEVSSKTIQRDLEFMRDRLGLPLEYDGARFGFHYTQAVTEFPAMEVSEGEVAALFIAEKALAQHRGTAFEKPLRAACRKIAESLRGKISVDLAELDAAISFRTAGAAEVAPEVFEAVSRATLRGVEIAFQYHKLGSAQTELRRVRPYHLGCVENQWYCFGFCLDREELRTFALPRMRSVRLSARRFTVPADFSIARHLGGSFGVFSTASEKRPQTVRIRFDAWAARLVRERLWHESQRFTPREGGEVDLALKLGGLEEVERWILSWGEHARVLAPKRLRERIRKAALVMAAGQ
jgi:predicted DNA-binding transcriptional regulator YafY